MFDLIRLLAGETEDVPLDVAALQLAQIEYPGRELNSFLVLLDSYAQEFSERVSNDTDGEEFIALLNDYLFGELGFRGDTEDYYNPANSCLNDVLTRRLGIPITLSLTYMEIARRLGRPVYGIGLPGHFVALYDDGDFAAYLDPFHEGALLTEEECIDLAVRATGSQPDPSVLKPVGKRQIMIRMLNNLRAVYFQRKDLRRVVDVLGLLIRAEPGAPDPYKQRGMCLAQLNAFSGAESDLETYLRLSPNAGDRGEIVQRLDAIRRQAGPDLSH